MVGEITTSKYLRQKTSDIEISMKLKFFFIALSLGITYLFHAYSSSDATCWAVNERGAIATTTQISDD